MNPDLLLANVHGHVTILAVALAFHPVLSLWRAQRPTRRVRLSGYLATLFVVGGNALGWWIYPEYREQVKPQLYAANETWGELFEIKEHLAFYALCLSVAGSALLWAAKGEHGPGLRSPIRMVWLLCGLLTAAAAGIGTYLVSIRAFDYVV